MTPEDRNGMLQIISDLSKDAFGFRVRKDYSAMSDAELQETWDYYCRELEDSMAREKAFKESARKDWTSRMSKLSVSLSAPLKDVIRWDMDAEGANGDIGFYCYLTGMSFEMEPIIKQMLSY